MSSRLEALSGKPKTFTVGGIELELKPLRLKDMHLFNFSKDAPMEEQTLMIKKVLRGSIPDSTDEEIDNIAMEYMNDLMTAILKLHNLDTTDVKQIKK